MEITCSEANAVSNICDRRSSAFDKRQNPHSIKLIENTSPDILMTYPPVSREK